MIDAETVRSEIIETHVTIERWFGGEAAPDDLDALLARFSAGFRMISPTGAMLGKSDLRGLFGPAHAARPGLRITIEDVQVHAVSDGCFLATYREDHADAAGSVTTRLSTVLFEAEDSGLTWKHLHETWIAEA